MHPRTEVVLSVLAYSLCSGTLVLLNKLILHQLPYPSLIISFQLIAALIFIFAAKHFQLFPVDPIVWKYVLPYLYYIVAFALGVYCNMKSLENSNVETVIVFRALSPCIVAILDVMFLGREYPDMRSWAGLLLIVAGAYGYASYDEQFQEQGMSAYFWPFSYLCLISFEMCYGKRIIRSVDLKTKSGPVLYTNMLGLAPMLLFAGIGHEYQKFYHDRFVESKPITLSAMAFLLLGCIAGTGIGYSSWWCRDQVSATSFTLIGVMNKCLTVLLNCIIWDKHAKKAGIACLFLCLAGGSVYRQSPLRSDHIAKESKQAVANQVDDVWDSEQSVEGEGNDGQSEKEQSVALLERGVQGSTMSDSDVVKRRV